MHTPRTSTTLLRGAPWRVLLLGREVNSFRLEHTVLHQLCEQERLQEPTQVQNQQLHTYRNNDPCNLQVMQQPTDESARTV